jgi:hypothetical protein
MAVTVARLVKTRHKINARISELQAEQDLVMKPLKEQLTRIDNALLNTLNQRDEDSVRTSEGTVYRTMETYPNVTNWDALYKLIADEDLASVALDKRVKKSFVIDYIAEHDGELPPGVTVRSEYKLHVRRPTK